MLSRTADHVYWLGRYAERAEDLARTLDVQYRLSLLPQELRSDSEGWALVLRTLGLEAAYAEQHDGIEPHWVIDFLAFDTGNPSSILSCLRTARENARSVRGSISSEMWETFNSTWLEARAQAPSRFTAVKVAEFIDWVKYRAHLAREIQLRRNSIVQARQVYEKASQFDNLPSQLDTLSPHNKDYIDDYVQTARANPTLPSKLLPNGIELDPHLPKAETLNEFSEFEEILKTQIAVLLGVPVEFIFPQRGRFSADILLSKKVMSIRNTKMHRWIAEILERVFLDIHYEYVFKMIEKLSKKLAVESMDAVSAIIGHDAFVKMGMRLKEKYFRAIKNSILVNVHFDENTGCRGQSHDGRAAEGAHCVADPAVQLWRCVMRTRRTVLALGWFLSASLVASAQAPSLSHSAPKLGTNLSIDLAGAQPGASVRLYFSPGQTQLQTPFGMLELARSCLTLVASGAADPQGRFALAGLQLQGEHAGLDALQLQVITPEKVTVLSPWLEPPPDAGWTSLLLQEPEPAVVGRGAWRARPRTSRWRRPSGCWTPPCSRSSCTSTAPGWCSCGRTMAVGVAAGIRAVARQRHPAADEHQHDDNR